MTAVGGALTGIAHAVERLPFMPAGEDPTTRVPRPRSGRSPSVPALVVVVVVVAATAALRARRQRA